MGIFKTFTAKNGKRVVLRSATKKDLLGLLRYINSLVRENAPVLENRVKTLEEEKKFLAELLRDIKKKNRVHLVSEVNGKVVGTCDIRKGEGKRAHIGIFGIGVIKGYRNLGIGKEMTRTTIDLARKRLKIEGVKLEVYDTNKTAQRLYKKFGFRKVARIPKDRKEGRKYSDSIIMQLWLKEYKPPR